MKAELEAVAGRDRPGAGAALGQRPPLAPPRLPGHGRGRQGRHHQARHVRREPAGVPRSPRSSSRRRRSSTTTSSGASAEALPERGRIGIFNRSHYEEVLVVRVHPDWLERQQLPPGRRGPQFWKQRYESINGFEQHLDRNGTTVVKFFLHVSKAGAAPAVPRPPRRARQGVEVLRRRRRRAPALGRLHGRLRGRHHRHVHAVGAVVRHPGRPQVPHADAGRRRAWCTPSGR